MYRVEFTTSAAHQVRKLPKAKRERILERLSILQENPRPMGVVKLAGLETAYRIRVGDYRVIFDIADDVKEVTVVVVAHRREAYRGL